MNFSHTFFEDEVRDGFYVSGMMKRFWAAQLEVLFIVDEICKKHNIKWFIEGGTLLGAIRHKGYIPWDDDLDITMLREDYDKFNEIVRKELPQKYVWLHHNNEEEPRYHYFTRITNSHELMFDKEHLEKYHQCPYVVGIDIFPLDYLSDDAEKEAHREKLVRLSMSLGELITPEGDNVRAYKKRLGELESLCDITFDYNGNIKQQLYELTDRLYARFANEGGEYVALMPCLISENKYKYPARYYDQIIELDFEGFMLPAPEDYDGVLRVVYGDYMEIVKDGGDHEYPVFSTQEEFLISLLPEYHFKYTFAKEHLENPVRAAYVSPKSKVKKFVSLMERAYSMVKKYICDKQYEESFQLLITCQNSAINIGTMLEEHYGEGLDTVKVLEDYCEMLYQLSVMLQELGQREGAYIDLEDLDKVMEEIFCEILNGIDKDISSHKKVLFIGYKAEDWKAFEKMWQRAKAEPDAEVNVMPIPYYEIDAMGKAIRMHYEAELYPDYLDIVDYKTYDIEKQHPDVIFIQNPYDECNYTTAIMPEFYSAKLKGFTEKLVYIPWFNLADVDDDEKSRKTMDYFCKVPGLVHSDVVLLQSENMRNKYIQCLTEFAGEDTRGMWEKKIHPIVTLGEEINHMI